MSVTTEQTVVAIGIILRWAALWMAVPFVIVWALSDLHSIATDLKEVRRDLQYLRATYEGRKAACEEMKP